MIHIFSDKNKKNIIGRFKFFSQHTTSEQAIAPESTESFQNILTDKIYINNWNHDINESLFALDQLQHDLISNPSIPLIDQYRKVIGQLLTRLLDNYQSASFFRGMKNRIQLKTWKTIDSELESLAQAIIQQHVTGFQVLHKINFIKGIIVDLKIGKH